MFNETVSKGVLMKNTLKLLFAFTVLSPAISIAQTSGMIGEYPSPAIINQSNAVPLPTKVSKTITSILLPVGDWDVNGTGNFVMSTNTASQLMATGISTKNDVLPSDTSGCLFQFSIPGIFTTNMDLPTGTCRISVNNPTTVYLVSRCDFTSTTNSNSSCSGWGVLRARRASLVLPYNPIPVPTFLTPTPLPTPSIVPTPVVKPTVIPTPIIKPTVVPTPIILPTPVPLSSSCTSPIPPQASEVGFTNMTFCNHLSDTKSIDVNNTRKSGYNWYLPLYSTDTAPNPNHIMSDGTGVYINDEENSLPSASGNKDNKSYMGKVFGGGFYAEVKMKWVGKGCADNWPVFWFQSANNLTHGPAFTYFPSHEIDVFEFESCGSPQTNVYEFTGDNEVGYGNSNNLPMMGNQDYSIYHKYAVRWVTQVQGNGTGHVDFYFDDVLKGTVPYKSNGKPIPDTCRGHESVYNGSTQCPIGTFSGMDNEAYVMILNGVNPFDVNNKAIYKDAYVFQSPTIKNTNSIVFKPKNLRKKIEED